MRNYSNYKKFSKKHFVQTELRKPPLTGWNAHGLTNRDPKTCIEWSNQVRFPFISKMEPFLRLVQNIVSICSFDLKSSQPINNYDINAFSEVLFTRAERSLSFPINCTRYNSLYGRWKLLTVKNRTITVTLHSTQHSSHHSTLATKQPVFQACIRSHGL